MDRSLKEILWKQFGAAIDMLENALVACPQELWNSGSKFWYTAYHTLFYLDYYLSYEPDSFMPPAPFTLSEFDSSGALPERAYTKQELLNYLQSGRKKCYGLITGLTGENANKRFVNMYMNYSILELLLYNMRHVQHHAAQLNLLLRQNTGNAPKWVSEAKVNL